MVSETQTLFRVADDSWWLIQPCKAVETKLYKSYDWQEIFLFEKSVLLKKFFLVIVADGWSDTVNND